MGTVCYTVVNGEVLSENRGGVRRDYWSDSLGNTLGLQDSTGAMTDTFDYFPSGTVASRTGTTPTPFQYVGNKGYYRDNSSRMYVRARVLNSSHGRWMTQDPIGFYGSDWNLYRYVGNNPRTFVDMFGLWQFGIGIGGIVGIGAGFSGGIYLGIDGNGNIVVGANGAPIFGPFIGGSIGLSPSFGSGNYAPGESRYACLGGLVGDGAGAGGEYQVGHDNNYNWDGGASYGHGIFGPTLGIGGYGGDGKSWTKVIGNWRKWFTQ